jgi:hypothetical protein
MSEKSQLPGSFGIRKVLALHRTLNPGPRGDLLIGLDQGSGQLFFLSRRGSTVARDAAAALRRSYGFDERI